MISKKKIVFVGMSGGVDSSVSAAFLKKLNYEVVGVFIHTWQPDFIECSWRDDRRDAMRVCAQLEIPFLECDAIDAYKREVAEYMINEYKIGNTPNPDIVCNREIKFGVFWDFARSKGADFIATGHYAQIKKNGSKYQLLKSIDPEKDQSYFLWTLTQEDLAHTLFPIGHLKKQTVRKIAQNLHLPTAQKKDSQGVCFLGPLDMKKFLSHYLIHKKGDVIDEEGEVIGYHRGAVFFTLGERHGFIIHKKKSLDKPYYVIGKDVKRNTLTVGHNYRKDQGSIAKKEIRLFKTNWIGSDLKDNITYKAQIRYHGNDFKCIVKDSLDRSTILYFQLPQIVAKGQSIVVYKNNICCGGGIVT